MHIVRLLLTILYLTPFAVITWHTVSERLPTYRRIYFPDSVSSSDKSKEIRLDFLTTFLLSTVNIPGYFASYLSVKTLKMSTRYWDEIDWYIQEGTQKLSELLNSENDDASSSKWSTGEEEDEKSKATGNAQTTNDETMTENITKKFDDISIKDEDDGDSLKDDDDYMERSTSVEDENPAILKKQTKIDELMSLCTQCSMMPPIYTYFTTGDEQVVSTVQLWNGVRFSSHPQITRDKAMEEAAGQALGYLKSELRENRPVSTSPPTTLPYYMPVQNLVPPQYYAHHAAYASPVSYTSASPQPYFIPSVPYTVLPQTPVVSIPSEYQQAAVVHPQYRLNAHQYNPYMHHYPLVRVQVSPSHQPKPAYHIAANPKPVIWTGYPKDSYFVQDKANSPRTEFKLLDQPPASTSSKDENPEIRPNTLVTEESLKNSAEENISVQNGEDKKETGPKKHVKKVSSPSRRKQNSAKPKLAISFNNTDKEK